MGKNVLTLVQSSAMMGGVVGQTEIEIKQKKGMTMDESNVLRVFGGVLKAWQRGSSGEMVAEIDALVDGLGVDAVVDGLMAAVYAVYPDNFVEVYADITVGYKARQGAGV